MKGIGWPAAVVALAFIALVGLMFWRATQSLQNFNTIWVAAGPVVGVVVGAVPGAAFGTRAHRDQKDAQERAEVYAAHMPQGEAAAAERTLSNRRKG